MHCRNHVLNLALQDAASGIRPVRDALSLANELSSFFKDSAKRTGVLDTIIMTQLSCVKNSAGLASGSRLLPLCPTRWCVRARSLGTLLKHYEAVLTALDTLSDEPGPTGTKADGLATKLRSFECLFTLKVASKIFAITEELGTTLQSKKTVIIWSKRECQICEDST